MKKQSFILCIGVLSVVAEVKAQNIAPLPIDVALGQQSFPPYAPISLSPDGRLVAYVVRTSNKIKKSPEAGRYFNTAGVPSTAVGNRIWITEISTGHSSALTADTIVSWGPAWSPDGKWLAYYSDADGMARLWLREVATGKTRRASEVIVRGHRGFEVPRWIPDSRGVVVPILPTDEALPEIAAANLDRSFRTDATRDPTTATVTVLRADPKLPFGGGEASTGASTDSRGSLRADLALIDIETGIAKTVAHGYWPLDYAIAPSGRYLAFSSAQPYILRGRYTEPCDVVVVPLDKKNSSLPKIIASNVSLANLARNLMWAPDGTRLLYSAVDTAGREEYFVADENDWRPRRVGNSGAALEPEDHPSSNRSLWWDPDGRAFYIVGRSRVASVSIPDGAVRNVVRPPSRYMTFGLVGSDHNAVAWRGNDRSILAMFYNDSTKRMGFARVIPDRKSWQIVREENQHIGDRLFAPLDVVGDRLVFLSEDSRHPTDLWTTKTDFSEVRQLSHVSPSIEKYSLGATRLIEWKTTSGSPRRGTLLLPSGYTEGIRYPLVTYPYPATMGSDLLNEFGVKGTGIDNMQLLATRGFAVFVPDVPPIKYTDQMRELASIILPGVNRVVEMGIADSTRLGIMGHSWGGYTVIALLVQTNKFSAAVMRGGEGDQVASYGTVHPTGYASGAVLQDFFFGGPPWEKRELYQANSPIYFLNQVTTPLLIIHGESETTVPLFLANQVFAGLQRLGKEVVFARYAGENHNEMLWSSANQIDYLTRVIEWFQSKLQRKQGQRVPAQIMGH
jgi:dipeptidyl aminopeptidase/acylaminoacyl peptidase